MVNAKSYQKIRHFQEAWKFLPPFCNWALLYSDSSKTTEHKGQKLGQRRLLLSSTPFLFWSWLNDNFLPSEHPSAAAANFVATTKAFKKEMVFARTIENTQIVLVYFYILEALCCFEGGGMNWRSSPGS